MGTKKGAKDIPDPATSRFCYRIGQHSVLLESGILAEVLSNPAIYPIPFAPEWCAGFVSLRGDLFPVINMHKVLTGKQAINSTRLLLIHHPSFTPVALTCDGYPFQLKLSAENQADQQLESLPGWIPHAIMHEGRRLLAADHGRLFRQIQHLSGTQNKDFSVTNQETSLYGNDHQTTH